MPATAEAKPDRPARASARLVANEALREAGLARQAILAHERQCVERSREVASALERIGHDLRDVMAQTRESRGRLHDRVDRTDARMTENQEKVMEAFDDLRKSMIRALFTVLLSVSGAFAGVLWYLLTGVSFRP